MFPSVGRPLGGAVSRYSRGEDRTSDDIVAEVMWRIHEAAEHITAEWAFETEQRSSAYIHKGVIDVWSRGLTEELEQEILTQCQKSLQLKNTQSVKIEDGRAIVTISPPDC